MVFILILAALLGMSSSSFIGIWLSMEIGTLFFMPMVAGWSYPSKVASWKYFYIQSLGSIIILAGVLLTDFMNYNLSGNPTKVAGAMILLAVALKLGMIPFHGWVLQVVESMDSKAFYMMNSWLKVTPLVLVWLFIPSPLVLEILILLSLWSLSGLKSTSFRWILSFSSSFNLGWLILALCGSTGAFLSYLGAYLGMLTFLLSMKGDSSNSLVWGFNSSDLSNRMMSSLFIMSLSGLPPMLGFFMKLDVIMSGFSVLGILLLVVSGVFVYAYLQIFLGTLMKVPSMYSFGDKNWFLLPSVLGGVFYIM